MGYPGEYSYGGHWVRERLVYTYGRTGGTADPGSFGRKPQTTGFCIPNFHNQTTGLGRKLNHDYLEEMQK